MALGLALAVTLASARASAAAPDEAETHGHWQGASWGFELRSGASLRMQDESLTPAPIIGLGFRVCTLLTLIDSELFVQTMGFTRTTGAGEYDMRRLSVGIDMRLHPLFIRPLQGGFGDRLAAGIHLVIGAGIDSLAIRGPDLERTDASFAFGIGLGAEVPLNEPNRNSWSIWLGLGWRLRFVGFPKSAPGLRDMDEHQLLVSLSLRFHDLTGIRLPPPPELDDVDR
jgi:hypothetical protein